MLEYARRNDVLPYAQISQELGKGLLAPVQVQMLLREETEGTSDFSYFVRSSLIRNLHEHVPRGFRMHGQWPLILALSSWAGSMGTVLGARCARVASAVKTLSGVPDSWLPSSVLDPVLDKVFSQEGL
jgi:hypothetical protein